MPQVQMGEDNKLHFIPDAGDQMPPEYSGGTIPEMPPEIPPELPPKQLPQEAQQAIPAEQPPVPEEKTAIQYSAVEDGLNQWIKDGLFSGIDMQEKPKVIAGILKILAKATA